MGYYFKLQYLRNLRRIKDFGIHPLLAISIVSVLFIGTSLYVFTLEYHQYIYTTLAVICGFTSQRKQSNSLINGLFDRKKAFLTSSIEIFLVVLPFLCFLVYYQYHGFALTLILASALLVALPNSKQISLVIPTPFSRRPFEFCSGFRRSILLFIIHAFLLFKAIEVGNFNLGLFSIFIIFFVACSFFFKPESALFVWIFAKTPTQFLRYKISIAIRYYLFLILPSAVILFSFFPANIAALFGLCAISLFYLVAVILAKYAAFPNEIQLPQLIFLGLSLLIPPFLIITIYQFHKKSIHNLNSILAHDKH
jgi:hypothetical protein